MLSLCFKGQFAISITISITFGAGNLWHTPKKNKTKKTILNARPHLLFLQFSVNSDIFRQLSIFIILYFILLLI